MMRVEHIYIYISICQYLLTLLIEMCHATAISMNNKHSTNMWNVRKKSISPAADDLLIKYIMWHMRRVSMIIYVMRHWNRNRIMPHFPIIELPGMIRFIHFGMRLVDVSFISVQSESEWMWLFIRVDNAAIAEKSTIMGVTGKFLCEYRICENEKRLVIDKSLHIAPGHT